MFILHITCTYLFMPRQSKPKIFPFEYPSGKIVHRVYGCVKGKIIRRNFDHDYEAEAFLKQLKVQVANQAADYSPVSTWLSPTQVREAERAFELLKESNRSASLESLALEHIAKTHKPRKANVKEILSDFIRTKRAENKRQRTISNLEARMNAFLSLSGIQEATEISISKVQEYLERLGISPRTARNDRLVLSNFCAFCVDHSYLPENPVSKVKPPKVEEGDIRILSLEQSQRLIEAARELNGGSTLKYFAIALYAGIRPNEIERLDKKAIDLEHKIIRVTHAKARGRRIVDIQPALFSILEETGALPIIAPNHRRIFDQVRQKSELLDSWQEDILRHSFISYTMALTNDENYTARQAGNSPDVIYRHYFAIARKPDAEIFFDKQR